MVCRMAPDEIKQDSWMLYWTKHDGLGRIRMQTARWFKGSCVMDEEGLEWRQLDDLQDGA